MKIRENPTNTSKKLLYCSTLLLMAAVSVGIIIRYSSRGLVIAAVGSASHRTEPSTTAQSDGFQSVLLARGNLAESKIKLHFKEPIDVAEVMITLQPGADGGWHYHTGPEFIIVKTGAITLYGADGCSTVYPAGSVIFADVEDATHAHLARNETSEVTTFFVTFFVPPGAPTRIDAPNPGGVCGQ